MKQQTLQVVDMLLSTCNYEKYKKMLTTCKNKQTYQPFDYEKAENYRGNCFHNIYGWMV